MLFFSVRPFPFSDSFVSNMGLRTLLVSDAKVSLVEFWWIVGMVFVGVFLLTLLNGYLKTVRETTVIQVQTPRLAGVHSISESPYSIQINITHRMHVPELRLPPAATVATVAAATAAAATAAPTETKKTL